MTLSQNTASSSGGGIYNTSTLNIGNTILEQGANGANISNNGSGTVNSQGYNLSNDSGSGFLTGTGDQVNKDPMLGPLQDNELEWHLAGSTMTQRT